MGPFFIDLIAMQFSWLPRASTTVPLEWHPLRLVILMVRSYKNDASSNGVK